MLAHAAGVEARSARDPAVTIDSVELVGRGSDELAACELAEPAAGSTAEVFALDVSGWVVPRSSRAEAIRVLCHGEVLAETPVDVSRARIEERFPSRPGTAPIGFRSRLGAFRLPPRFELWLEAALERGEPVPLARVRGRRRSLRGDASKATLRPVIVSTPTGRTGTTWAVNLLSRHPALVAQPPVGMEPRPATYWLEAAAALSEPASYMQSLRPRMQRSHWWLGAWPEATRQPAPEEPLSSLLGRDGVIRLAAFARERVEAFYGAVAESAGKRPVAFVEKGPSGRARLEVMADVFPGLREIVLVRDPRDTLCSILAYKRKRPQAMLVREDPGTDEDYLVDVARSFEGIVRQAGEGGERALLVRYEDLVLDPTATLQRILEHLDVDSSESTVGDVLELAAADAPRLERHRTAVSDEASVGRWRRDMSPALQARAGEVFAGVIERLGYD